MASSAIIPTPEFDVYFCSVVDTLATRLQRPVLVETVAFDVVAYSRQDDAVDPVRADTILGRRAAAEVALRVSRLGLERQTGATRVHADPGLRMDARVCVPLRDRETLLGYLWILDPHADLSADALELAEIAAVELVLAWVRCANAHVNPGVNGQLLRTLLQGSREQAAEADREVARLGIFGADDELVAYVVSPARPTDRARFVARCDGALAEVRSSLRTKHALQAELEGEGVVVVAAELCSDEFGERLRRAVGCATGCDVVVGTSGVGTLSDIAELAHQARYTGEVARVLEHDAALRWDEIGVYKMLSGVVGKRATALIHPGLLSLLQGAGNERLVETLECYLDNGCDAKQTSAQLFVHRTSLYYRLSRIEEIADVDVRRGDDRLSLHLGLKLARLSGLHQPTPDVADHRRAVVAA